MRYSLIAFFLCFVIRSNAQLNSTPPPGADSIVPMQASGIFIFLTGNIPAYQIITHYHPGIRNTFMLKIP